MLSTHDIAKRRNCDLWINNSSEPPKQQKKIDLGSNLNTSIPIDSVRKVENWKKKYLNVAV